VIWQSVWKGYNAYGRWLSFLPKRRSRRILISAMYLGLTVYAANLIAIIRLGEAVPSWRLAGWLIWLTFMLSWLGWLMLSCWAIPVIMIPPAPASRIPIDERQQAVRDRAYRRAYQSSFLLFVIAGTAAYILQEDLPGILRRITQLGLLPAILSVIGIVLMSMPVAFLAWTEPDDSADKTGAELNLPG
jgi:hypothetical protein